MQKDKEILFCKSGGCTAKLGAGVLARVLEQIPKKADPNLLVGFDSHDDAAVYQINKEQAIVSTLDFFPPMVEDPYLFGQIAAANALSDIYAMGGKPISALNIVCFPESMDMNILGQILLGGNSKVTEAGAVLAGGHSIQDTEVKYGLSVTGIVDPENIYTNNGCQEGDAIILTKKLGVGILMAAQRVGMAARADYDEAIVSMTTLNQAAARLLSDYEVHAVSDVTGFGLLVHLSEMLDGKYSAVIQASTVPVLPGAYAAADEFCITAAGQKNRNFLGDQVAFEMDDYAMEEILFDPQTSGGLLVSLAPGDAEALLASMQEAGIPAACIGQVTASEEKRIKVVS